MYVCAPAIDNDDGALCKEATEGLRLVLRPFIVRNIYGGTYEPTNADTTAHAGKGMISMLLSINMYA